MSTFSLGNLEVKPGEVGKGHIGEVLMADGSRVSIPLVVHHGREKGPRLVVLSGVHGTEVSAIRAVHDVLRSVKAEDLKGTLIAVTLSNPIATGTGQYISWVDETNLSSAFSNPDPKGSITQRMASYIWKAIHQADYLVDMHANPMRALNFVLTNRSACKDDATREGLDTIAKAFGVTIVNWDRPVRSMRDVCASRGVPAITPELDGNIQYWYEIAQVGSRGLTNVMKALGMLEGPIEEQKSIPLLDGDLHFVGRLRANTGGFANMIHKPGVEIERGKTAVEIYDVYGELVEEVKMPVTGYCWSYSTGAGANYSHAISEGVPLAYVFEDRKRTHS